MVLLQIIMKLKWCFNNYFVYRDNLNGVITLSGVLGFGWQLKWCYEDFSIFLWYSNWNWYSSVSAKCKLSLSEVVTAKRKLSTEAS